MGLDFDKVFVEPLFHAYLLEGQSDILEKACEELVFKNSLLLSSSVSKMRFVREISFGKSS